MKRKKIIKSTFTHILLLIMSAIVIIPIYYLVVTTFKSGTEAALAPMALPKSWDFSGYVKAFKEMQYPRAFGNTFFITSLSVIGIIVSSSMCGYVLNRKEEYKITKVVFLIILSGIMFPYQMSILGLYKLIKGMGLMNSLWSVIFINIAINIPFATFLMKSYISAIPKELEAAAKIDGAGVFRIFGTIIFPLLKPVIATVTILNTLTIWNDFMGPLYFLQTREKGVILQEVYRNIGQFSTDWTSLFPMMVLGVLPLLIFYLFMQRFIIGGVMAGSVKG
ncbi:raffinose/stachyose/melibiose transport system permease protein [Lachnospiraceae bacterium PF1-22]|uniref:carbohydrate ABC transporter permease n=1 Tax=Ohessyouella blattaphilus TaxID=2949333 RepID=UPI003E1F56CF